MNGPLCGIRVFDLTRILAGPSCTQMLGDLGADVVKIERPATGDDTRGFAPPYIKNANGEDTSESAYFCCANRNKRSITLDIATRDGQKIARQLIAKCQVVVENFKTGGLSRYSLGYEQLKDEFPGLVYCSITGFGHTGPYAKRPGYDVLIQAMSGLMSCTGEPDGEPMKAAIPVADLMSGMYAAVAINAALRHREATGEGQHIDIGMLDAMVAFSTIQGMNYLASGEVPRRLGNAHPNIVPYQALATADGAIILAVGNDGQFERFCNVIEAPDLAADGRFATNSARVENRDELLTHLRPIMARKPSRYWLESLEAVNVSCGPINDLKQVFEDPQVVAREMTVAMEQSALGGASINLLASPMRLSKTPVTNRIAPPLLGQHTDEVLHELLALDEPVLAALRVDGVI